MQYLKFVARLFCRELVVVDKALIFVDAPKGHNLKQ
jgi:hypothetical protein